MVRVHQLCLEPFYPHALVHLTDQSRVENSHHFHEKVHPLPLVCYRAVLPQGILFLLVFEGSLVLFETIYLYDLH